jgi:two-component system response regulator MprA
VASATGRNSLLLIEDDPEVVRTIRESLDAEQFSLDTAATVAEARQRLAARTYDAIVLDLGLPDGNGLELANSLRAAGNDIPILMLTAQSGVDRRLDGFAHGADDYLCKPFAVEELVARLQAILRRARPERQHMLRYAGLELDLLNRVVRRHDLEATLSDREAALLAYLMRNPEQAFSRSTLVEEVWGDDAEAEGSVVNVYINYLRNKLERSRYPRLIHTVRGVGYMLSETNPK